MKRKRNIRLSLYLPKEQIKFMDSLIKKCRKNGIKLSRSRILYSFIKIMKELKINYSQSSNEEEVFKNLLSRITRLKNY